MRACETHHAYYLSFSGGITPRRAKHTDIGGAVAGLKPEFYLDPALQTKGPSTRGTHVSSSSASFASPKDPASSFSSASSPAEGSGSYAGTDLPWASSAKVKLPQKREMGTRP